LPWPTPKLFGEREQARQMLDRQPANRPAPGTAIVVGKGLPGEDAEAFFARPELGLTLVRPARKDETIPRLFPALAAPARRGDHLDAEEPARPRTALRPRPGRAVGPHRPAPARPQRCDLAQLGHRCTGHAPMIACDH